MRIREGDPLEIYTDRDGSVIFKKYSLLGGVTEFAAQMCDTLNRTTGRTVVITDRDSTVAVAGAPRRELADQAISPELERLMEGRQIYQHKAGEAHIPLCAAPGRFSLDTAAPILSEGDVLGCVVFRPARRGRRRGARWSTSWPNPPPLSWGGTWRADPHFTVIRGGRPAYIDVRPFFMV